ncbi:trypsin-like peptidase domain-containing protein [Cryomorpha ignava]|uniref:Trypsin-like peptidase domain-containing protein n=1 Tax=Cryomorpha ignava TaxID=101383 RepID=A0A7K3WUV4_9FLAO|nr:serine protease [Cryomorpha ignava]NEN24692.1 trypsin-like peptidase domain-containing protein [Cryomorpha ignava]
MKNEELHKFTSEDWKLLESQFAGFSLPVIDFVTENKGSLSEAEEIYINAFIYYTQLLELHGLKLSTKAEDLIYSFSRKLWIKVLGKRNVDVNFVKHRRSFFEMEDAFHEIESINERSEKTAEKLAEVGEPARTLILEHIGRNAELAIIGSRLGYSDEDRAFGQISKSLRKLIRLSEGKTFELDDADFKLLLRYVLDNQGRDSIDLNEEKKVAVTMISRSVAMIRSYVTRNQRIAKLKEMQERIHPDVHSALEKSQPVSTQKNRKMKPIAVFALSAIVALSVSVMTAFGISGFQKQNQQSETETEINADTLITETVVIDSMPVIAHSSSAFAISNDGLFITAAKVEKGIRFKLIPSVEGEVLIGEVVFSDTAQSLAIIKCTLESRLRLPYMLSFEDPKIAQELYSISNYKQEFFYTEGKVNAAGVEGMGKVKLDNTTPGAPIVSEKGQILGMVLGNGDENMNLVITSSKMKEAISKYEENSGLRVQLVTRNGLFYSNRTSQVELLKPFIYEVKNI